MINIHITGRGVDYNSGPYIVAFPAGVTTKIFEVLINDDDIIEGNEDFMLTINSSSLPRNVTVGNPGEATVTIRDNGRRIAVVIAVAEACSRPVTVVVFS